MKKTFLALALAAGALLTTACTPSRVPAGHVGIRFNLYGDDKGVQLTEVRPGRYWLTINEEIYKFPTFTQNYTWEGDEAVTFQDKDGASISADVGITYRIDGTKVTTIFQEYRKGLDEITSIFLRNTVRDAVGRHAGLMGVEALYGSGKAALMDAVLKDVQEQVGPKGILVEKIFLTGKMKLPSSVATAIDDKIKAGQFAKQREAELATAQAEAAKAVAAAQGEADAIAIKGRAIRENPEVLKLTYLDKWNGVLPTTVAGNNDLMLSVK